MQKWEIRSRQFVSSYEKNIANYKMITWNVSDPEKDDMWIYSYRFGSYIIFTW